MRILILGASGMMGHAAFQHFHAHHDVYATTREGWNAGAPLARVIPMERCIGGVDAHRWESVAKAITNVRPDVVLNCIGIVKQLDAAKDAILSLEINSMFPHRLAALCALSNAKLIHLSTDCVFSGRKGNYTESDNPDPVDLYGRSKLLGETEEGGALTLRTSIIGRQLRSQTGLVEWLASRRNQTVKGYARAMYSGLTTLALSVLIEAVLERHRELAGVWHVSSAPISKYELLRKLNERLGLNVHVERDEEFRCDRSLNSDRFVDETGISIPSWDEMIRGME